MVAGASVHERAGSAVVSARDLRVDEGERAAGCAPPVEAALEDEGGLVGGVWDGGGAEGVGTRRG